MVPSAQRSNPSWAQRLVELRSFQGFVLALILLNAVTLGLETSPAIVAEHGPLLHTIDAVVLGVFVVELLLRLAAYRGAFFRDPWSLFDLAIVLVALAPAAGAFAVLRALRILRVLRLVSMVASMRRVVGALLSALPGMTSIAALLALVLYVAGVLSTKLFADVAPEYFGALDRSFFTLFQIMTMEGWADVAREIMQTRPWAWTFFVAYILVSTFTVLNLFIAVVVNAMQEQVAADHRRDEDAAARETDEWRAQLLAQMSALRAELELVRKTVTER